jgi:hypothetical protein
MASFFRNKVINEIGTTPVDALATANNSRFTVIGLSLANLTEGIVLIDVQLEDDIGTVGYYARQILIPPNSSLRLINGGEKLILAENNTLSISANIADAVDAVISYVELI